jgi:D-alanyl-D-alanine carboxypeptidase
MRSLAPAFATLLILGGLLRAADAPAAPSEELGPVLERIAGNQKVPGLAGIILRGDTVIADAVTGFRRIGTPEPITLQDRFHLGSNTKAMTATLAALLVDEGKLAWSTTLWEIFREPLEDMHEGWKDVTLQQLLAHRSGLPANFNPVLREKVRMSELDLPAQRQMIVADSLRQPPDYPPGSKYEYSNLGFIFVGAILERIAGQPWETLMRERLFAPLGIASAGFGPPGTREKLDEPWGHNAAGRPVQGDNPAALGPAGTVHMAVGDWAKFVALHLRGDPRNPHATAKLLKPETFAWLHAPHDEGNYFGGWVCETNANARGTREGDLGTVLWHNGSNTMWYAIMYLAPEMDCAVLIAANRVSPEIRRAIDAAARTLLKHYARMPAADK